MSTTDLDDLARTAGYGMAGWQATADHLACELGFEDFAGLIHAYDHEDNDPAEYWDELLFPDEITFLTAAIDSY